jgi:hypothetical protein
MKRVCKISPFGYFISICKSKASKALFLHGIRHTKPEPFFTSEITWKTEEEHDIQLT